MSQSRWTAPAACAIYLVLVALLVELGLRFTGGVFVYAQDDPYIHLSIARTLAEHAVWGIRPEEFASASSSPLWSVLLAIAWKVGIRSEWTPLAINLAAGIVLLVVVDRIVGTRLQPSHRFAALVGLVLVTPLPTLALIGMEHTLQILLCVLLVWTALDPAQAQTPTRAVACCALAALLAATRYEGLFVVVAVAVVLGTKRRMTLAVLVGVAAALPLVAFGIYSMRHGALPVPNSVLMKSGPGRFATLSSGAAAVASDWFAILTLFSRPPELVLTIAAVGVLAVAWKRIDKETASWGRDLLVVFVSAMALHVCLVKLEWFFRYEAYLIALGYIALVLTLAEQETVVRIRTQFAGPWGAVLLVVLGLPLAVRSLSALAVSPTAMKNVFEQQYQLARFVAAEFPDAPVALNDIGLVSWVSAGPIVDVMGLATPEIAELKRHRQLDASALNALVLRRGVRAAAIYPTIFAPIIPDTWTLVGEWTIQGNASVAADTVGFFAPTRADIAALRRALDAYAGHLPAGVIYRPRGTTGS